MIHTHTRGTRHTSQLAIRTQEQRFVNHTCVKKIIRIRRNAPYVHKKRINTYEKEKVFEYVTT